MVNRRTPLYEEHEKLGAKIIDFHGWDMPLQYTRILEEHMAVRNSVGIFDVSHMGDIIVEGKDSGRFLDSMFPTRVSDLKVGEATYTAFLNDNGTIIDDTIVYRLENEKFFFVPNASTIELIYNWVNKHRSGFDVNVMNISQDIACIAVQGPKSTEIIRKMGLEFPEAFHFNEKEGNYSTNKITGNRSIIVSGTGYTGEIGVELLVSSENAPAVWSQVVDLIKEYSGLPCGLGARDTLRMEKGMLLSGTDFNGDRNPYECSISFIVNNDGNFIGKKAIEDKGSYRFRGFTIAGKSIPRAGSEVYLGDEKIGIITSGTLSPVLDCAIALGFVQKKHMKSGPSVGISVRGKTVDATMGKPKIVP